MANKRKVLFINPKFQLKFMIYFIAFTAIALVVFYTANAIFIYNFEELGAKLNLPANHIFFKFIAKQESKLNLIFGISAIVLAALQIPLGLVLSHKIAGPIHRFTKTLKSWRKKEDEQHIKCREGDFFPEMFDSFNGYLDKDKK